MAVPCEREAVFGRQLASPRHGDYRPRAERTNLLRDIEVKLFVAANDMNPHSRVAFHILGRARHLKRFGSQRAACFSIPKVPAKFRGNFSNPSSKYSIESMLGD